MILLFSTHFEALSGWCDGWPDDKNQEPSFFSPAQSRSAIVSSHLNGNWSVRTPAWFLRAEAGKKNTRELYFKPDDHWEVNDLAERCSEVVRAIEQLYGEAISGKPMGPLDDILVTGI